jgi:opacity protein-like surface antigen
MKNALKILAVALIVPVAPAAQAIDGVYGGVSYVEAEYKEDGVPTANPSLVSFRVGSSLNKNLAVEGRFGVSLGDDQVRVLGVDVDVKVDNFYGLYAKGILPLGNAFSLYGLVGFTQAKVTASALGNSASTSDSDLSYGFGADFELSRTMSVNLEWAKLVEGDAYKLNGISVGMNFRF